MKYLSLLPLKKWYDNILLSPDKEEIGKCDYDLSPAANLEPLAFSDVSEVNRGSCLIYNKRSNNDKYQVTFFH